MLEVKASNRVKLPVMVILFGVSKNRKVVNPCSDMWP